MFNLDVPISATCYIRGARFCIVFSSSGRACAFIVRLYTANSGNLYTLLNTVIIQNRRIPACLYTIDNRPRIFHSINPLNRSIQTFYYRKLFLSLQRTPKTIGYPTAEKRGINKAAARNQSHLRAAPRCIIIFAGARDPLFASSSIYLHLYVSIWTRFVCSLSKDRQQDSYAA